MFALYALVCACIVIIVRLGAIYRSLLRVEQRLDMLIGTLTSDTNMENLLRAVEHIRSDVDTVRQIAKRSRRDDFWDK